MPNNYWFTLTCSISCNSKSQNLNLPIAIKLRSAQLNISKTDLWKTVLHQESRLLKLYCVFPLYQVTLTTSNFSKAGYTVVEQSRQLSDASRALSNWKKVVPSEAGGPICSIIRSQVTRCDARRTVKGAGRQEEESQVGEGGPGGSVPGPGQKTYYRLPGLLLRGRAEVFSGPKIGF